MHEDPGRASLPAQRDRHGRPGRLVRAVLLFQIKLAIDGLKDVILSPLAVLAILFDWKRARRGESWESFSRIMDLGERFERWLALYGEPGR
ncbi:MAG: hypothetical protein RRA92_10920, partial [Gemmatimonadota bacterium]|nr:hypothetical protein [Gemmatimonadota bacterium]